MFPADLVANSEVYGHTFSDALTSNWSRLLEFNRDRLALVFSAVPVAGDVFHLSFTGQPAAAAAGDLVIANDRLVLSFSAVGGLVQQEVWVRSDALGDVLSVSEVLLKKRG